MLSEKIFNIGIKIYLDSLVNWLTWGQRFGHRTAYTLLPCGTQTCCKLPAVIILFCTTCLFLLYTHGGAVFVSNTPCIFLCISCCFIATAGGIPKNRLPLPSQTILPSLFVRDVSALDRALLDVCVWENSVLILAMLPIPEGDFFIIKIKWKNYELDTKHSPGL